MRFEELDFGSELYFLNFHGQIYLDNQEMASSCFYYPSLYPLSLNTNRDKDTWFHNSKYYTKKFKSAKINIASMAYTPIGSILKNGEVYFTPKEYIPLKQLKLFDLKNLVSKSIPDIKDLKRLINMSDYHKYENIRFVHLTNDNNFHDPEVTDLIIPCTELYRFYYLSVHEFNREILKGEIFMNGTDGVYDNKLSQLIPNKDGGMDAYIHLADYIPGHFSKDIARILLAEFGFKNLKRIRSELMKHKDDNNKSNLRVNFPYDQTEISFVGKKLPVSNNRVYYLVYEIISDFTPPIFDNVIWNKWKDNRREDTLEKLEKMGSLPQKKDSPVGHKTISSRKKINPGYNSELLNLYENRFPSYDRVRATRGERLKSQTHESGTSIPIDTDNLKNLSWEDLLKDKKSSSKGGKTERDSKEEEKRLQDIKREIKQERSEFFSIMQAINSELNTREGVSADFFFASIGENDEYDVFVNTDSKGNPLDNEHENWRRKKYHKLKYDKNIWIGEKEVLCIEVLYKKQYYYLFNYGKRQNIRHSMILFKRTNTNRINEQFLEYFNRYVLLTFGKVESAEKGFKLVSYKKHPEKYKKGEKMDFNLEKFSTVYKIKAFTDTLLKIIGGDQPKL